MSWIPIDHLTQHKPEVFKVARLLKIPRLHAFGLWVATWILGSEQSVDGHVDGMTSHDLDAYLGHPGFAAAAVQTAWLEFDDTGMILPNLDRHCSSTAKARLLHSKRQAEWRANKTAKTVTSTSTPPSTAVDAPVDGAAPTDRIPRVRGRVRGKEKPKSKSAPTTPPAAAASDDAHALPTGMINGHDTSKSRATRLTSEFRLPDEWIDHGCALYPHYDRPTMVTIGIEFRDHWAAETGPKSAKRDWRAAWRTWLRNATNKAHFGYHPPAGQP